MIAEFEALRDQFRAFGVENFSMVLVCTAMLYGIVRKEQMTMLQKRLMKYGILFFVLIANPFSYHIIHDFWMEDYGNLFMVLLPVVFLATVVTDVIFQSEKRWQQIVLAVCCIGVFAASTFFNFSFEECGNIAESWGQDAETATLDEILREADFNPIKIIAPREVGKRIREKNPGMELLFGETLIKGILNGSVKVEEGEQGQEQDQEREYIHDCATFVAVSHDVDYQITLAERYGSNCIILENVDDASVKMKNAGFICYGRTQNYTVYLKTGE